MAVDLPVACLGALTAAPVGIRHEDGPPLRCALADLVMLLAGACFRFFLAPLMQDGLGLPPLRTGPGFLPHTLITTADGVWAPPRSVIVAGAVLAAAG